MSFEKLAKLMLEASEAMMETAQLGGVDYDPHGLSFRLQMDKAIVSYIKYIHPEYLTEIIEAALEVKKNQK